MSKFFTAIFATMIAVVVSGAALVATPAAAAPDADKAALKQATATCRAQVKEQAHFEALSLYARHKLVKKCVNDTIAGH
jgi:short-subunit dehydrogenase involved in D-alanine esterification of teichoic acids